MPLTIPEWLTKRNGDLRQLPDGLSWSVLLNGNPQYRLAPIPAKGKYGCEVMQTINGKRLEKGGLYPLAEDAILGGLDDLRQSLGW